MKILKVTVEGFKSYKERQSFSFGMANHIFGGHGEGKTALGEAIIWCLKGCDSKGLIKGVKKRLMNPDCKQMLVTLEFEQATADGRIEHHTLTRKSTARHSSFHLDGGVVSQSVIDEWTGHTDLFLSIFSPGYFGGISGIKARDVLISLLPELSSAEVLMTLESPVQQILSDYDLSQPLQEMNQLKLELKEWEENLQEYVVRLNTFNLKLALQSSPEMMEAEDEQLKSVQAQIQELELADGPILPEYVSDWEEELAQLGAAYREEVLAWKQLNAKVQGAGDKSPDFMKNNTLLMAMKSRCQELLDQGYFLRAKVAEERKAFEEELADFHVRNHQELQLLRQAEQTLESKRAIRNHKERWIKETTRCEKEIETSRLERDRIIRDISHIHAFLLQYANLQVEAANRQLKHAEICLAARKGSDGEMILHHRLLFKQQEYFLLSGSDRFRCALELSKLAKIKLGISVPIFMDDGDWEAVEVDTQYFITSHVPQADLDYHVFAA